MSANITHVHVCMHPINTSSRTHTHTNLCNKIVLQFRNLQHSDRCCQVRESSVCSCTSLRAVALSPVSNKHLAGCLCQSQRSIVPSQCLPPRPRWSDLSLASAKSLLSALHVVTTCCYCCVCVLCVCVGNCDISDTTLSAQQTLLQV